MTATAYAWLAGATLTLVAALIVGHRVYDAVIDPPDRHDNGGK